MKQIISAKYKRFVLYVEIFIVILLLPVLYNFVPVNQGTATFYIPSSNIEDVTGTLEKNGYTVTWIDKLMLQLIRTPQEGWYSVKPHEQGRFFFFEYLHKQKTDTMDVIVYGGETAQELVARLAKDMKLDKDKLLKNYQRLTRFQEADIFAKRYTIARKADENTTMQYLFDSSQKILEVFEKKYFHKKPDILDLKVLLTIASIIQKESNSVKEMPAIASVIYNRLNKGMKLQMDSTLNYGEYSHSVITPQRIKTDTSYYNTYKHKGLPPYPLGTVTEDALYAAIHPLRSDYLFFMLNKEGKHDFAASYAKHLENLKAFREHQKNRTNRKKEKKYKTKKIKPSKPKAKDRKEKNAASFFIPAKY
ncbi:endolytic transglycosylase MltG [Sulfurovum sp.]|uniref:endolytic transglycosylase MltG n=1 Tax=Sulfurovum sp. TaxID=1969726 RepID=UPI0025E70832|nr:endolytic transglycosylase MltG [Sulfurovum sp.]